MCVRVDAEAKRDLFESTIGGRGGLATCIVDATGDVVSALHGYAGPQSFQLFLESADSGYKGLVQARSAVEKQPNSNVDLYALGEAYRSLNSLRRAEQCYLKVVEQAGKTQQSASVVASCHERIARLRILRGKNLEARKHLDAIRVLDPDGRLEMADRTLLTEALTLAVERKHLDAARVLQDALKRFPASAEADHMLFALGFVLHQAGQDKPALEALEAAQQRFPQSSWLPAVREQIEHLRNPQPDHTH